MVNSPSLELVKAGTQVQQGSVSTTKTAPQEGESLFETVKTEFNSWINDTDKTWEDDANDGKLTWKEKAEHLGKGFFGIVKTAVKHPVATGLMIAGGAVAATLAGPVIGAAALALGAVGSIGAIGSGIYNAHTAKTDAEAKQAYEMIGNGAFGLALVGLNAKDTAKAAQKAGIIADNVDDMNALQAIGACFKAAPKSLANAGKNIFTNTKNIFNPGSIEIDGKYTLVNGDELQSMSDGIKVMTQDFENTSPWKNTVAVRKAPTEYVTGAIKGSILDKEASAKLVDYLSNLDEVRVEDWGSWQTLADMKLGTWSKSAYITNTTGPVGAMGILASNSSASANTLTPLAAYEIDALIEANE